LPVVWYVKVGLRIRTGGSQTGVMASVSVVQPQPLQDARRMFGHAGEAC
jgi:hypothetical protein